MGIVILLTMNIEGSRLFDCFMDINNDGTQEVFFACNDGDGKGKAYAYTSDWDLMWSKDIQGNIGANLGVSNLDKKWTFQIGIGYWYSSVYRLDCYLSVADVVFLNKFHRSYIAELEYRILNSIKAIFNIEYGKWRVDIAPKYPVYPDDLWKLKDNFFGILNVRLGSTCDFFKNKKLRISGGAGISGGITWEYIGGKYFGNNVISLPLKFGCSFTVYVEKKISRDFVVEMGLFLHYEKIDSLFRRGVNLKIGFVL